MERFVRNLLEHLPELAQVEARYGCDHPRLAGALAAYYHTARSALRQVLESYRTDPEDEDTDEQETGDPIANLHVPPLDDETVDLGHVFCPPSDPTRCDLRGATQ